MKTHYQLLDVARDAPSDEIKRAFRREIARYHPDKVQHLGAEFQEIAASRAAELTTAYRTLMDAGARAAYDAAITAEPASRVPPPAPASAPAESVVPRVPTPTPPPPMAESLRGTRESVSVFVKKAMIVRLREAAEALSGMLEPSSSGPFDAVFTLRPRRGLFQKAEPPVRVSVRVVDNVDGEAVESLWPLLGSAAAGDSVPCVLLCGTRVAPPRELAAAIAEQRRRHRQSTAPILIPVDTRDWDALLPPDTPGPVRKLLQRLKLGG